LLGGVASTPLAIFLNSWSKFSTNF